jgi:hypothetical protein
MSNGRTGNGDWPVAVAQMLIQNQMKSISSPQNTIEIPMAMLNINQSA